MIKKIYVCKFYNFVNTADDAVSKFSNYYLTLWLLTLKAEIDFPKINVNMTLLMRRSDLNASADSLNSKIFGIHVNITISVSRKYDKLIVL